MGLCESGKEKYKKINKSLSVPISRDIAILALRYPILRDTFEGTLALPQNGAIPPLVLSFTQAHLCDTPFCNISRDNCAIPHKNQHERVCDTIATSIALYEKYRCWASKTKVRDCPGTGWVPKICLRVYIISAGTYWGYGLVAYGMARVREIFSRDRNL